jgi:hypothetical protein
MSRFTVDWLTLREPADRAARSAAIAEHAAGALPQGTVRALDLATGTGSNVRYLAPRLPQEQDWLLVDADERLLHELPARMRQSRLPGRVRIDSCLVDLSALERTSIVEGCGLVTASALLDLVSDAWVASLSAMCRRAGAVVLLALTYNGRISCSPAEPEDEMVRLLVNRHQHGDKGFGPALGPDAPARAEGHFGRLGYVVTRAGSDWVLTPDEDLLQQQLLDGWAEAATAIEPGEAPRIRGWNARRQAHVAARRSRLVVGHEDLVAVPQTVDRRP